MNNEPSLTTKLRILQINLNKSLSAHLELINDSLAAHWDVVLIQEPYITFFSNIRTPNRFIAVAPTSRAVLDSTVRSTIWVNTALSTNNWKILDIPDSNDIVAIELNGGYGSLKIFSIYNAGENSHTLAILRRYMLDNRNEPRGQQAHHILWGGDFNRHHPMWDRDEDSRLFTAKALEDAQELIELIADQEMYMPLPKGIPTLKHMVSKRLSRPDNVFCTNSLADCVLRCDTMPERQPGKTDHYPIVTILELEQRRTAMNPSRNFRETDWEEFNAYLGEEIATIPIPDEIRTEEELGREIEQLTTAIQKAITAKVPENQPCPLSKRWWTKDLKKTKKLVNHLRAESYRYRAIEDHPSHQDIRQARRKYAAEIAKAKTDHWNNYLENADGTDIWTVNRYLSNPIGDGGRTRVPTLKVKDDDGTTREVNTNEDKARSLAKAFFPPKPAISTVPQDYSYSPPLPSPPQVTEEQIRAHITKLSPYKAPGPDQIPNIVLQKTVNHIVPYLLPIYRSIIRRGIYYRGWQESTTCVLRKPGKPSYEVPKAYRPIALLCTMAKVLTSIVSENLISIAEQQQLLPDTHFGGRPCRSTTDAVHLLIHQVKEAWRKGKVVSILFLDIEGAFPNAVMGRLLHNMRKRRVPSQIVKFIERLLNGRTTRLKFDDYISAPITIDNGVGQGDPISLPSFNFYNADLLELTDTLQALGYVDDAMVMAVGKDFEETTQAIRKHMEGENGGFKWSADHNSRFEISKLAIMHLGQKKARSPNGTPHPMRKPKLNLQGREVNTVDRYRYLGIVIDDKLTWKRHEEKVIDNATKWVLQCRRLAKTDTGLSPYHMRRLYMTVAIPKMTYGAEIWYSPPRKIPGAKRMTGSVRIMRQLTKIQRIATLAINGALRTTPTDTLDIHAGMLPLELTMLKVCHRSLVRICTLPESHPLHQLIREYRTVYARKHRTPLHKLLDHFPEIQPGQIETITPNPRPPAYTVDSFTTEIAQDRDTSMLNEAISSPEIKVFTDGSGINGNIGAAAVMYRKGRPEPSKVLRYHLGSSTDYTSFEAEAVGAIMGIWMIRNEHIAGRLPISVLTDCQAFIKRTKSRKATTAQYLVENFLTAADNINLGNANPTAKRFQLAWISGHSGVQGNEKVDEEAKKAAQGESSPPHTLPPVLREELPRSVAAVKQKYHDDLKKRWNSMWLGSPRQPKLSRIDPNFTYSRYTKIQSDLSRHQASLLTQVRTGHIPLNFYLHRIKKSDTSDCNACQTRGLSTKETITHFLFECGEYNKERHELDREMRRDSRDLSALMSSEKGVKALVSYIVKTGRLCQPKGEYPVS